MANIPTEYHTFINGKVSVSVNMCVYTFREALRQMFVPEINFADHLMFTYFRKQCDEAPPKHYNIATIDRMPSKYGFYLDNKKRLEETLRGSEVRRPRTFLPGETVEVDDDALYFIKDPMQANGTDMKIVWGKYLCHTDIPKDHIIQREVDNIRLIGGHKFTTRLYVLWHNKQAWLYWDGLAVLHNTPYNRQADYYAHISHSHRNQSDRYTTYPIRGLPLLNDLEIPVDEIKTHLSPYFKQVFKHGDTTTKWLIVGIDYLIDNDGNWWLLEINQGCALAHRVWVDQQICIPMIKDAMYTMLGVETKNWIKLI